MAQTLHLYALLVSNNGLQNEMNALEAQMQGLQPGSAEYQYDLLQLEKEHIELQTREKNPQFDPQTVAGNDALQKLLDNNSDYQAIEQQIEDLISANPVASSSWGIPMDSQDTKYVEIN